jgi:hypothetical protein
MALQKIRSYRDGNLQGSDEMTFDRQLADADFSLVKFGGQKKK